MMPGILIHPLLRTLTKLVNRGIAVMNKSNCVAHQANNRCAYPTDVVNVVPSADSNNFHAQGSCTAC